MVFSKLTKWQQDGDFLVRLAKLLKQGFSIEVSISYLALTNTKRKQNYQIILTELEKGELFADALMQARFPTLVYAPLFYATEHHHFEKTIQDCGELMLKKVQQQKTLQKTFQYPLVLFVTVFVIFMLLKIFLLPKFDLLFSQLARKGSPISSFHSFVFDYLPWFFLVFLLLPIVCFFLFISRASRKKVLPRIRLLCRIPLLCTFIRLHYSQLFARECGYLLSSGLSLSACLKLFQKNASPPLFQEIASYLENSLSTGATISKALHKINIFDHSLIYVIQHGEQNGTLAEELLFYFELCNERILFKTDKLFTLIQPLTFLIIGLLIIYYINLFIHLVSNVFND